MRLDHLLTLCVIAKGFDGLKVITPFSNTTDRLLKDDLIQPLGYGRFELTSKGKNILYKCVDTLNLHL